MSRLTKKISEGYIRLNDGTNVTTYSQGWEAIKKLSDLEDLEDQGSLLELPFAIGENVYYITPKDCFKMKVKNYTFDGKLKIMLMYDGENEVLQNFSKVVFTEDLEKTVFSTYAEAKKTLKEDFHTKSGKNVSYEQR